MTNKTGIGSKGVMYPIRSNWSSFPAKKGVFAKPTQPSKFVPKYLSDAVSKKYWRDLPTQAALQKRFDGYVQPISVNIHQEEYDYSIKFVTDTIHAHVKPGSLSPNTFSTAWKALKQGTSSGYPFYIKKGQLREETFRQHAVDMELLSQGSKVSVYPCSTAARSVIREIGENKPRLVWVYPIQEMIKEAIFAPQLIESFKEFKHFGWSFNWMENGEGYWKWYQQSSSGRFGISADFSSFDSTVISKIIRDAFGILRPLFKLDQVHDRLWQHVVEYFIHTPLIMHHGVVQKHRGIPSGSYFTQLIGCIVNAISIKYVQQRMNIPDNLLFEWSVLGDDSMTIWSCAALQGMPDVHIKMYKDFCAELGLNLHPDKTELNIYTGDYWDIQAKQHYLGMQLVRCPPHIVVDTMEVSARIVLPERTDTHPLDTLVRTIGLAWSYGHNQTIYRLIRSVYDHVIKENPGVLEQLSHYKPTDPEVSRWFEFVFYKYNIDMFTFPEHEKVKYKYFGYI
jgi:hypothetical protein